jgi:hypothetical protein
MNKFIYASLFLLLAACAGNNEKAEKQETETEVVAEKKYACPMKCEGEKTYAEAGTCPVCKMDLQEIAMAESDSTGHAH